MCCGMTIVLNWEQLEGGEGSAQLHLLGPISKSQILALSYFVVNIGLGDVND